MKICFMCDLHLPHVQSALQYKVLDWALDDMVKKGTDCIIYAGDVTCDGNIEVYREFLGKMESLAIPFLFIPGNSDLRSEGSALLKEMASPVKNNIGGISFYAVNDCDKTISTETVSVLEEADSESIVFMHHPMQSLREESREKMAVWRENHKETMLFHAHLHRSGRTGNTISLQAMDPDKASGENPCITYYDTVTKEIKKAYYFCPVPLDLYGYFGVSCYRTKEDILFAAKNKLQNLELRAGITKVEEAELLSSIKEWRESGGENLSVHLPDVVYQDETVTTDARLDACISLAKKLGANRFTQHVPKVAVGVVEKEENVLEKISAFMADKLNAIEGDIIIGIENMHMTGNERADETRRFGYTPEECLRYMHILGEKCKHKVGINFDIGHARNNSPYSQKYQISTWLTLLGEHIVGYHLHQVSQKDGAFENHMPITDIYGHLISFASFFGAWADKAINKAPIIFEMRPQGAYEETLKTFNGYKEKNIFDLHSHTYYSGCGRDNPRALVETAIRNGISMLGISDHKHGIYIRKAQYLEEIGALKEEYKDKIKILCGVEIATRPLRYTVSTPEDLEGYEYCFVENITDPESAVGGNLFAFCESLGGILCGIAHTDLFAYCDMYGYDYEAFFAEMAEKGIFWEMNVSYDSIHKYKEHQYVVDFMADPIKSQIVKNAGVYISVGFDSHRMEDYDGFRVHQMYDFLKENGFKTADALFAE